MIGSEFEGTGKTRLAAYPIGATVSPLSLAEHWRSVDARLGRGHSRRERIRARKRRREPFVYTHRALVFVPHKIVLGRAGGRTA